jgi:hypothetical protein
MKTLRTRIVEVRRRLAEMSPGDPGWAKATTLIHEADFALRRATKLIKEAEEALP